MRSLLFSCVQLEQLKPVLLQNTADMSAVIRALDSESQEVEAIRAVLTQVCSLLLFVPVC